jgi:hypothetical protein
MDRTMLEAPRRATSLGTGATATDPKARSAIIDKWILRPSMPQAPKGRPKVAKIRDGIDVAARHLVYKIYEATDGQPKQGAALRGMAESAATISYAVERGWVVLQGSKPLERKAALTDEGRRLARRVDRAGRSVSRSTTSQA